MKKIKRLLTMFVAAVMLMTLCVGTLTAQAASYRLQKTSAALYVGGTLNVKLLNSSGKAVTKGVTYSSSNKTVATVTSAGKVTAKSVGSAKIMAKYSGKTYTCTITVKLAAPKGLSAKTLYKKNTINWQKVAGAKGYRIYRAQSKTGKYALLGEAQGLSFTDAKAELGVTYYYKVYGYYMSGSAKKLGTASAALTVKSLDEAPSQLGTSAKLLGAKGDGKTDDTEALRTQIKYALFLPAGDYKITSDIDFDVPVTFAYGARLILEDGVTVTFNKNMTAGLSQIVEGGSVILKENSVSYPEWFGADKTGKRDSTQAICQAIGCFPNGYGKVEFAAGRYLITDTITIDKAQSHLTLEGVAHQTREISAQIVIDDEMRPALYLLGATGGRSYDGGLEDVTIENMEFSRSKMGAVGSDTVLVENTLYATFRNVGVSMSQNGIRCVNTNGTRFYTVHGTTGGDLPGSEVRGIFIDGSKRGSTGVLIDDYIYYGYGSPNSTTIAYKDVNLSGSVGDSTGDRRIKNFECSGPVDYGIYISSAGGFSSDISIMEMSMDGVDNCGIYLKAPAPQSWQQVNITNVYLRIAHLTGMACAVNADGMAFVHVTNLHVDNAEGENNGVIIKNSVGSSVTGCSFGGTANYFKQIAIDAGEICAVTGNTSNCMGAVRLTGSKNCTVTGNTMPYSDFSEGGTGNVSANNIFA